MGLEACTLPTEDRPLRLAELEGLFTLASDVRLEGGTARMHLSGDPGLMDSVVDLTDRETQCCSFFRFAVTGSDTEVDLEVSAPAEHHAVVSALASLAREASA